MPPRLRVAVLGQKPLAVLFLISVVINVALYSQIRQPQFPATNMALTFDPVRIGAESGSVFVPKSPVRVDVHLRNNGPSLGACRR